MIVNTNRNSMLSSIAPTKKYFLITFLICCVLLEVFVFVIYQQSRINVSSTDWVNRLHLWDPPPVTPPPGTRSKKSVVSRGDDAFPLSALLPWGQCAGNYEAP